MFEMFNLTFMMYAFIAAVISGLLLSYLGVHVVRRGIVFVDLALGQISSLGVAIAAFAGLGETWIPILATVVGAFLLSLIKIKDHRLKQEAIIGIIYAIASAVTVLLISKAAHGDSAVQEVLFGNILAVNAQDLYTLGGVFAVLGLLQFAFRKQFFELTRRFEMEDDTDIGLFNIWNFLFYITIGLAIVFAVEIGGVIPVFAYLIIPSVCGMMLTHSPGRVVLYAVLLSVLGGFLGLNLSYNYDFPAGSSIVAMLGLIFVVVSVINLLGVKERTAPAAEKSEI